MRIFRAIVCLLIASACVSAAFAADDRRAARHGPQRAQPPFHHYYPTTGVKPKIGRDEVLSAPARPSADPQTTYRRRY